MRALPAKPAATTSSYENSIQTDPVNLAISALPDGELVKKSEEQRVLTDAERATFHLSFTVDGLVTPKHRSSLPGGTPRRPLA